MIPAMRARFALLALMVVTAVAACTPAVQSTNPSPTATVSATATATPASTPTPVPSPTVINGRTVVSNLDDNGAAVVAGILFPPSGSACAVNAKYDSCPVTDGLATRLDSNPLRRAEPLCRCQNTYTSRTIMTTALPPSEAGAIAHVVLDFGGSTLRLDITVLRTAGGWFANDTSCTGQDPQVTSSYAASPPPCG